MKNKKKCYVIMPMSATKSCTKAKWTEIFEELFKPAVEEAGLGYECERSRARRENIIKQILNELNTAHVVIADLTDRNPNVFYELGVRHTLKNRTILIAQGEKFIPFDLKPYPTVFYDHRSPAGISKFKREIKEKLEDIETDPERADSPVADFLSERNILLLSYEKSQTLRKLTALISELSRNIKLMDSILDHVKRNQQAREKRQPVASLKVRLDNCCLQLLASTLYIITSRELLEDVNRTSGNIGFFNEIVEVVGLDPEGDAAEVFLQALLPEFKKDMISQLREISKLRLDYANDNYIEPETPAILLSSPEHEKYLEATK